MTWHVEQALRPFLCRCLLCGRSQPRQCWYRPTGGPLYGGLGRLDDENNQKTTGGDQLATYKDLLRSTKLLWLFSHLFTLFSGILQPERSWKYSEDVLSWLTSPDRRCVSWSNVSWKAFHIVVVAHPLEHSSLKFEEPRRCFWAKGLSSCATVRCTRAAANQSRPLRRFSRSQLRVHNGVKRILRVLLKVI